MAGKCKFVCPPGLTNCSGLCVSLKTDAANCGVCGTACAKGQLCMAGTCKFNCPPGQIECNSACVSNKTDVKNCGTCGTACKVGEVCLGGLCTLNCPPGQVDCSGVCSNPKNDPNNCGKCGTQCGFGQVCQNGKCEVTCVAGAVNCNGACSHLNNDPANCGKCGNKCASGQTCKNGKCVGIQCDVFTYGLSARAVDIVFVIDQSGSMNTEIKGVKTNLNKFSTFIAGTKMDYRVVMLASRGTSTYAICIAPPLGGKSCADGPRYKQINYNIQSRDSLQKFQTKITDIEAFMRKDSLRQIIEITDDRSNLNTQTFHSWLIKRTGWSDYVFHSIVATKSGGCTANVGTGYVWLSNKTGGIIQHICTVNWTTVWNAVAKKVTGKAITQYAPSKTPDTTSLEIFYDNVLKKKGTDWDWNSSKGFIEIKGTLPPIGTKIMACYLTGSSAP